MDTAINTKKELNGLAGEFEGEIEFKNPTAKADEKVIEAARRLAQLSCNTHTIVIPDGVDCMWAGDGSGDWIPAMVFIPNKEAF